MNVMHAKDAIHTSKGDSFIKRWILCEAKAIGFNTEVFINRLWMNKCRELYTQLHNFLHIYRSYTIKSFEAACKRALYYNCDTCADVMMILQYRLESLPLTHDTDVFGQKWIDYNE